MNPSDNSLILRVSFSFVPAVKWVAEPQEQLKTYNLTTRTVIDVLNYDQCYNLDINPTTEKTWCSTAAVSYPFAANPSLFIPNLFTNFEYLLGPPAGTIP